MNIAYLLKCLNTTKLSELVQQIELVPLDMNLALWAAEEAGDIEIDQKKDHVKLLNENPEPWHNPELTTKLIKTIQHYAKSHTNPTRGRMNSIIKDPITNTGYLTHEYIMSMQYLVDTGQIEEETISVPKAGQRPYQQFIFYGLPENGDNNKEWNARDVNKWIDDFAKQTKKK